MVYMRKFFLLLVLGPVIWGIGIFPSYGAQESIMKQEKIARRGILLVAFGTSVPEAAQSLTEIEKKVREKYAGTELRWAYTSKTIRTRYAAQGKVMDSPETALAKLMDDGYTQVAVLSLHVVPGQEFHDVYQNAIRFSEMIGGFEKILVARPLLGNYDDMSRAVDVLARIFPAPADSGEGVIFIGHGNASHPSDAIYVAMDSLFRTRAENLFVGTVQGHPTPEELLPKLAAAKIRKVRLIPLMTVAGDHARKDMAGEGPGSWKSILAAHGIESEGVFSGLSQSPEIVNIWIDHLDEIISKM